MRPRTALILSASALLAARERPAVRRRRRAPRRPAEPSRGAPSQRGQSDPHDRRGDLVRPRLLRSQDGLRPDADTGASSGVAHRTLPCGTLVKVTYAGRAVVLPVLDRGPYSHIAEWDLTAGRGRRPRRLATRSGSAPGWWAARPTPPPSACPPGCSTARDRRRRGRRLAAPRPARGDQIDVRVGGQRGRVTAVGRVHRDADRAPKRLAADRRAAIASREALRQRASPAPVGSGDQHPVAARDARESPRRSRRAGRSSEAQIGRQAAPACSAAAAVRDP